VFGSIVGLRLAVIAAFAWKVASAARKLCFVLGKIADGMLEAIGLFLQRIPCLVKIRYYLTRCCSLIVNIGNCLKARSVVLKLAVAWSPTAFGMLVD